MKNQSGCFRLFLIFIIPVGLGLGLGACSPSTKAIPFELLLQSDESGYDQWQPQLIVVCQESEMDSLLSYYSGLAWQIEHLKGVDFSTSCLIAAFQGPEPSGGYSIEILDIKQAGRRVEVRARFESPELGATLGTTEPNCVVQVKKADLASGRLTFIMVNATSGEEEARTAYHLP